MEQGELDEEQGNTEENPGEKTNKNYNDKDESDEEAETRESGRPEGGGVIEAVKLGGGEVGGDGVGEVLGGGIFLDFAHHAVDVIGGVPIPAVGDGLRLADFAGGLVDVAVGVVVVRELGFGLLEGGVGITDILMLQIEGAGAEGNFLLAVVVDDVDDDVAKSKIAEGSEIVRDGLVVFSGIGI